MKTYIIHISIVLSLFLYAFPASAYAKVWINEFSSNGSEDWVELYNDSDIAVPLDGLRLRDATASNKIDLNGDIEGNGYAVFEWNNKLTNSGDTIKLLSINDESLIMDQVTYGENADITAPASGQSAGRVTNGGVIWGLFSTASKGTSNAESSSFPTPTLVPEKTPTPIKQPTPTRTPTPTKSPSTKTATGTVSGNDEETDTPEVLAINTKTAAKAVKISGVPTSILGMSSVSATPKSKAIISEKPREQVMVKSAVSPSFLMMAAGIIFGIACGILVFLKRRSKNHEARD